MVCESGQLRTYIQLTILVTLLLRSRGTVGNQLTLKCFGQYNTDQNDVALKYKDSHLACEEAGGNTMTTPQPPVIIDIEIEKANFAKTTDEMCSIMKACNLINDPQKYLQCYSEAAAQSAHKSLDMHLNASSIIIELSDEFEEDVKDVMRCTLKAKKEFIRQSINIYSQFLKCLET